MPRSRPRHAAASLLALFAMILTGCTDAAGSDSAGPGGIRLADAELVADPRGVLGPSTALLAEESIDPVARNPQPELPASVTDAQGTEVTVHDVSRILAIDLYGTASRTVFELGLGANVVGRDTSSGFAEIADLPLVTVNGHQLNGEAILELGPTVIVTDTSLGPWDVLLQMREAGIPVVVVDSHRTMDNATGFIRQIAGALGVPEEGEVLAERTEQDIEEVLAEIAEIVPAREEDRLRMLFLYARGQAGIYYIFGTGSGADQLIEGIGGIDVATEIGWEGMQPMTDEALVAAEPELVIMMTGGLESLGGVDGITEHVPALAHTPAGDRQRIVDMSDHQIMSFGPLTAQVLEALAVAVYAPGESGSGTSDADGEHAEAGE